MSKNGKNTSGKRTNPATLSPFADKAKSMLQVVIETPKGCRNKYSFNQDTEMFELKKVLPEGMTFPYDFGFVPSTIADDGDPVDVLVLMDEPAFTGCILKARLIGVIEGNQISKKGKERNDRLIAIQEGSHSFARARSLSDLGKQFIRELSDFFTNYHELWKEKFEVRGVKESDRAMKLVVRGERALKKS